MLHITLGADDLVAVASERYHHPEPDRATQDDCSLAPNSEACPITRSPAWPAVPGLPLPAISKKFSPRLASGCLSPLPLERTPWSSLVDDPRWVSLEAHFRQHLRPTLPSTRPADHRTTDRPAPRPDSGSAFPAAAGAQAAPRLLPYRYRPRARIPNTSGSSVAFWTTNSNRSFAKPVRASATSILWMPATSSSARSSATCGALCGCASGRPRAASVTTCWGRCTPSATS